MKDAVAANWVVETCTADAGGTFFTPTGTSKGYTTFGDAFAEGTEVFYSAHDTNGSREAGVATFRNGRLEDRTPTAALKNGVYVDTSPQPITFDGEITIAGTFNATAFNYIWDSVNDITDANGGIVITPEMVEGLIEALNSKADNADLDAETAARIAADALLQGQIDDINEELQTLDSQHLSEKLDQEIIDRQDGDAALQGQIDSKIDDAPQDTKQYARQDGAWSEVQSSGYNGADAVKITGDQTAAGHKTWTGIATFGDTVTLRASINGDDTANFQNAVTAGSFVKSGGTSSEYLMADGSVSTGGTGGGGGGDSLWSQNGADIYYSNGHIGVGIDTPIAVVHAKRTAAGARLLQLDRDDNSVGIDVATGASGGWGLMDYTRGGYDLYMENGNVGIGTDSPGSLLDIVAADETQRARTSYTDEDGRNILVGVWSDSGKISAGNTSLDINTYAANPITFRTNEGAGTDYAMTIGVDGNVDIGNHNIRKDGGWTTLFPSGATTDFHIGGISSVSNGFQIMQASDNGVTYKFTSSGTERFIIKPDGKVGIGANGNPTSQLTVNSDASGKSILATGLVEIHKGAPATQSYQSYSALAISGNSHTGMAFAGPNTAEQLISFGDTEDVIGGGISYYHPTDTMSFRAGAEWRMTIDGSGNTVAKPSGGEVTLGANGHVTSKQTLDVATAGGRYIGASNRGMLGQIMIEQTATGEDGGYMAFQVSPSGSTTPQERMRLDDAGNLTVGNALLKSWGSGFNFGNGNCRLAFFNENDYIIPANENNTYNNNAIDLGSTNAKFKDGWFAGNINAKVYAHSSGVGLRMEYNDILPCDASGVAQNGNRNLGNATYGFDNVFIKGTYLGKKLYIDSGQPSGKDVTIIEAGAAGRNLNTFWDDSQSTLGLSTPNGQDIAFHIGGQNNEKARITSDGVVWAGGHGRKGYGGVSFSNAGDGKPWLVPTDDTGSGTNGKMHLGDASYKFRDGYFSGALNVDTLYAAKNVKVGHGGTDEGFTGAGDVGLYYNGGSDQITPWNPSTNSVRGAAIDLGATTNKFKDAHFSGTVTAGEVVATSDERLKDDITTAPVGMVDQLRGVEFAWKESGKKSSGVIAQEVEKVLPHAVHDDGQTKSVNYDALVAYLIEEVKDLKAQVAELSK